MNRAAERSITDAALEAREHATAIAQRIGPRAVLHGILAECLALCERYDRDPEEASELIVLIREKAEGARRYFERETDIYLKVARFVFDKDASRQTAWRYANALRGAAERQVSSEGFVEWCRTNGGVAALSRESRVDDVHKTSILRLLTVIEVPASEEFLIRLRRRPNNVFEVLS